MGLPEEEEDDESYDEKMTRLTSELKEQFTESEKLQAEIKNVLKELGYAI